MTDTTAKIINRQDKNKELLIEQLKKTPIIQLACEKFNIARSTFYRWKQTDKQFAQKIDQAILDGSHMVNDMAESQLLTAIRDGNLTAIIFWLKHHHQNYGTKVELFGKIKTENEPLTPEQKKLIKQALKLSCLTPQLEHHDNKQTRPTNQ